MSDSSTLRHVGRHVAVAFALVATLTVIAPGASAARQAARPAGDLAVVVHPDVPADNVTFAELRRLLLGDREFWTSGLRVTLFVRAPVARERDAVVRDICQMTEAQFRQHWIAKVFRADTAAGPRIVYSPEMALDQVVRTSGAMTIVAASAAAGRGAKVLRIDGRLPGQAGYRLR
jgi:hypothetical protein